MTNWMKIRAVLTICAALGWWGIWFPELAVWAEVVCVVEAESTETSVLQDENMIEWENAREIYEGLLHADEEQIRIKSRLLMLIEQHLQKK